MVLKLPENSVYSAKITVPRATKLQINVCCPIFPSIFQFLLNPFVNGRKKRILERKRKRKRSKGKRGERNGDERNRDNILHACKRKLLEEIYWHMNVFSLYTFGSQTDFIYVKYFKLSIITIIFLRFNIYLKVEN